MPHDYEAMRESEIAKRTDRLLTKWRAKLLAGDKQAMTDLQNVITDNLSVESAKAVLAHAALGQSVHFEQMVARYMADECEAEAIKEVERIEKQRAGFFVEPDEPIFAVVNGPWRHLARA